METDSSNRTTDQRESGKSDEYFVCKGWIYG